MKKTAKIHITIPATAHKGLLTLKHRDGRSLNYLVTKAIQNFLKIKKVGRINEVKNKN